MISVPLRTGIAAVALGAAVSLSGCTNNDTAGMPMAGDQSMAPSSSAPASSSDQFNDADVMFVETMILHHQQAVAMSDIMLSKSGLNSEVRTLAIQIKDAQQPEIDRMRGWLADWGQPTMNPSGGGMDGMDHGGGDGMASAEEMQNLEAADAETGQRLYLQMMIKHHQGAVRMAQDEIASGKNPAAVDLARTIEETQQEEITQMQSLLARL